MMDETSLRAWESQFSDRIMYPTPNDLLRAVWVYEDLANRAQEQGDDKEVFAYYRQPAEGARSEYHQRSES